MTDIYTGKKVSHELSTPQIEECHGWQRRHTVHTYTSMASRYFTKTSKQLNRGKKVMIFSTGDAGTLDACARVS